jgi:hypothetical protein
MTTVYDNQTGNHKTNVITALNAGQNLLNHADHSSSDYMGTGYVNHDWGLENSDMDALTNGNKQGIFYSMGCDPAAYDVSNCIAEHFVRNSNGGGIAFIGNSRYGWYEYGQYTTLSMGFDVHFFKSLFQENLYHLGAAFSDHKNDGYQENPGDNYYKYIFTELTLLGDPELPVWTQNPATLVVSHPLIIPLGSSSFTVHVQTTGGSNVQNAYVCLWKGTEVYQNGYTNSAGNATFTVSPVTVGVMNVTVTKQNYIPSRSTVQTTNSNIPPNQPSSPVPTNNTTNVSLTSDCSWTGGDLNTGDIVTYDVYFGTSSTPPRVINNQSGTTYDPGTLNFITTYYWKIIAWDNHGASTGGPLWRFTTKVNSPPVFGTASPTNGSTDNPLNFIWSIPITDSEGNTFSWSIQCSNGQVSSGTGASNGTKSLALSGLSYSKSYKVWVNATDPSGSGTYTRRWYTLNTGEDVTPPVTTIVFNGTMGNNGWYISPVIFILTATDTQSGVDDIFYKIDAGVWSEYSLPVEMSEDGNHEISYYAADKTGNIEPTKTANISIDQTPPEITLSKQQINVLEITFTAQVSDETSGIDRVEFSIDGQLQFSDTQSPYEWTWTGLGDNTVTATAYDRAGNSQSQSMSTPVEQIQTTNFLQLQKIKQSMILSL